MKKILINSLLGTMLLFGSCDKFLKENPTDFVAPSNYYRNEKEVLSALSGVYDVLGKSATYGRYLFFEMDMSDQGFFALSSNTQDIALYNYDIGDTKLLNTWSTLYDGINRANMLLENIDKADMPAATKEVCRGEALFLRAYYYFVLTSNWGSVPLRLQSTKTPSEVDMAPAPLTDIYKQIVSDMETASEKVAAIGTYTHAGRITKSAVWGVLARVNLKMAGAPLKDASRFAEAKRWAGMVIDLGYHRLNADYSQVFKNHAQKVYDVKESIWEVEFSYISGSQYEEGSVGSINGIGTANTAIGYSYGAQKIMKSYYDLFQTGDERRDWNINDYYYENSPSTGKIFYTGSAAAIYYNRCAAKWRREFENSPVKSTNTSIINFPLLRYADVLLMYAEADNAMPGNRSSQADEYINQVRRRGYGKLKPGATNINAADLPAGLDEVEFQQAVQDERSKELGFEGIRRHDLVRWGIFTQTMKGLLAYKSSANASYQYGFRTAENITDRDTVYAIPRDEMTVNKLMKQNPGW
ncbi:RagB/SusD family nutrient uptake outer membrane protein [Sphingobacterium psychroaquaticum]|uniref:Starch-binding associating with outer membrane n=1 Tax=Sphingobacterium psychroaquaticum TaxID=561061 RepID=A0A1X7KJ20_9SPHI|nr:RagB/SusD family nutrient uptake outer membrane protein [Sphingobacterium psychroaquaticum]QBQ42768.1 RagB/SusD family nutrient uptake outer membrane protein [Sphingobacterium psychroaquaticum]SMG40670.1 Starch-binding associating with outer membrane [Sphingobacterium psychroaquaticum]